MATFSFRATDAAGAEVKGVLKHDTMIGARMALAERQLEVVDLKERTGLMQMEFGRKALPREEVMNFTRQLGAFMKAGVPILDGIQVIAEEAANPKVRRVLLELHEALRGGDTLSGAVETHRRLFPPFYVEMLRSAEATGHLDFVLDQLARYIERDLDARRKIRAALAYPAIILGMSMVTIAILTTFVLPRFRRFFESLDSTLPLPTRLLLGATGFMAHWWWAIGIVTGALIVFLWRFLRTQRGRRMKDGLALRLPVVGEVVRYAIIERFCRILSSMLRAGVPLPDAMAIVGEGTNNVLYEEALGKVREEMLEGDGLSRPIQRTGLFPSSVTQMVRVGEDTGTLDEQLEAAAGFFDRELDYKIKRLTSLFEPAVIVFMGVVVGFVAIALVSAMYGIFRQAGG